MALSQQVEDSLREAESNLRNALAFAARNEKPFVGKHISDMIMSIDNLIKVDALTDKMDEMINNKDSKDGPSFFGGMF